MGSEILQARLGWGGVVVRSPDPQPDDIRLEPMEASDVDIWVVDFAPADQEGRATVWVSAFWAVVPSGGGKVARERVWMRVDALPAPSQVSGTWPETTQGAAIGSPEPVSCGRDLFIRPGNAKFRFG